MKKSEFFTLPFAKETVWWCPFGNVVIRLFPEEFGRFLDSGRFTGARNRQEAARVY